MCYVAAELVHGMSAAGLADDSGVMVGDGTFEAHVRPTELGRLSAQCMIDAFRAAGKRLAAQYPKHVRVTGGGARD
jgi:hypothetical protein